MYTNYNKINYFNYMGDTKDNQDEINDFFTPLPALSYGNLSKNLYKGYKAYKPVILTADNPLTVLQAYNFILLDLGLYLDVNPSDEEAIKLYNAYVIEYRNLVERFEKIKYNIDLDFINEPTNSWLWVKNWNLKGGNR